MCWHRRYIQQWKGNTLVSLSVEFMYMTPRANLYSVSPYCLHDEREISARIGYVLLASATSGFSHLRSLPTAPLLTASNSSVVTASD